MTYRLPALAQHLEKIPYFVTIAKAGSLQKAAKELRVAQPSLTKSMHLLEDALSVTLFQRSRQGVTLTPAGEEFRRFAEPLLVSLATIERQLRDIGNDADAGILRIGTHEILVREFWPTLVREVKRAFPRLNLTLFTNPSISELVRRLTAAELDLIVCVECPPSPTLVRQEIRSDCYGLYGSQAFCREHDLTARTKLTPKTLAELPLVYASEVVAGPGTKLSSALRAAGIDQPSLHAVHSLESVASLIEGDLGLGLLPHLMVKADKRSKLVEIKAPSIAGGKLGFHRLYVATTAVGAREARVKDMIARVDRLLTKR